MAENKPKEERINTIINAAVSEFLEKGYEGTSVESISKRAGLSKGGFYHHFKNKDEILIAANYRYMEPINEMIKKAKSNSDSVEALKIFINDYLNYWSEHTLELQFTFLSLYKMIPQKEMWIEVSSYTKKMISFFESLFIKGILSGKFINHDPKSRAITLFSALDGITAYLVMNEKFSSKEAAENFEKVFIYDIIKQRDI